MYHFLKKIYLEKHVETTSPMKSNRLPPINTGLQTNQTPRFLRGKNLGDLSGYTTPRPTVKATTVAPVALTFRPGVLGQRRRHRQAGLTAKQTQGVGVGVGWLISTLKIF